MNERAARDRRLAALEKHREEALDHAGRLDLSMRMSDTAAGTPLPPRDTPPRRFHEFLTKTINELKGKPMSKMSAVAEAIAKLKAEDEAEADKLMARVVEHAKRRPEVIAGAHGFLDNQKSEMDDLESGMRQLANFPTGGSDKSGS